MSHDTLSAAERKPVEDYFDEVIDYLEHEGPVGGLYTLLRKVFRGVTYLLLDFSDDGPNLIVYAINSKYDFIAALSDKLGQDVVSTYPPTSSLVNEAAWDVLRERYEVVHFDEF